MNETDAYLRKILSRDRVIAVVGLSAAWHRPSHFVAKYLQTKGYRVIPVNPRYAGDTILDEVVYSSLGDIPDAIDMVDIFRRPDDVPPIVTEAIEIGAKTVWQQLGVNNAAADQQARDAGLDSVMDRCTKIEHARLFGGLHWAGVNTGIVTARRRGDA